MAINFLLIMESIYGLMVAALVYSEVVIPLISLRPLLAMLRINEQDCFMAVLDSEDF